MSSKKSAKSSAPAQPVVEATPAPAPAPVVAEAVPPAKKAKSSKKEASAPVVVEATPAPTPVAVAPVVASPVAEAPAPKKEASAKKGKKEKDAVEASPAPVSAVKEAPVAVAPTPAVVAPVPAVAPAKESAPVSQVESAPAGENKSESLQAVLEGLISQTESLLNSHREIANNLRRALKQYTRELREAEKASAKRVAKKNRAENKTPRNNRSGITGDTLLSDALCSFLGLEKGSKLPRTEVTKRITAYVKEHNLTKAEDKRSFVPDAKLMTLLTPLKPEDVGNGYGYFNLQHYMKHNYTSLKPAVNNVVSATA